MDTAKEQTSGARVTRPGKSQTPGHMAVRPPAKWEVSVSKKAYQCHETLQCKPNYFKKEWQGPVLACITISIDLGQLKHC